MFTLIKENKFIEYPPIEKAINKPQLPKSMPLFVINLRKFKNNVTNSIEINPTIAEEQKCRTNAFLFISPLISSINNHANNITVP